MVPAHLVIRVWLFGSTESEEKRAEHDAEVARQRSEGKVVVRAAKSWEADEHLENERSLWQRTYSYVVNSWNMVVGRTNPTHKRTLHAVAGKKDEYTAVANWNSIAFGLAKSITEPAIIKGVVENPRNGDRKDDLFNGGISVDVIRANTGSHNIATCPISLHVKFRLCLRPLFSPEAVMKRVERFREATKEMLANWSQQAEPINLTKATHRLALDMISHHLLDLKIDSEELAKNLAVFNKYSVPKAIFKYRVIHWMINLLTGDDKKRNAAALKIDGIVKEVISRERGNDDNAILRKMHSSGFTAEEISDTVKGLFFGGLDTSSSVLTFAIYTLGRPENKKWVRAIRQEFQEMGPSKTFAEKLNEAKVLGQVFQEALRLSPAAFSVLRYAANVDVMIQCAKREDDIFVKKGTTLVNDIYLELRDARRWGIHPDEFDPSRFNGEHPERTTDSAWGRGPNICLGQHFAKAEIKTVIAVLCTEFDWSIHTKSVKQEITMAVELVATDSPTKEIFIKKSS